MNLGVKQRERLTALRGKSATFAADNLKMKNRPAGH
jgi:hypothetical protein